MHTITLVNADWAPYNIPMMIGVMGPWKANSSVARLWAKSQEDTINANAAQITKGMFENFN